MVLSSSSVLRSSKRALTFAMAICMVGWSNWRGMAKLMFFLLDLLAGQLVFADSDLLKVMTDLV